MARRATVIKQERAKGHPVLLVDAGNSLVGDSDPAKRSKGASSVEAMNLMGYEAMALGSADVALGVEVLRERQSEAKFPFLSANVVLSDTGQLLATPYITRDVGGLKVAVLGLTDMEQRTLAGVRVTDPVSATLSLMPEIQRSADFVVILSHAGRSVDERIASEVPGVHWIIGGGTSSPTSEPIVNQETGTIIVQADLARPGHAGRVIGIAHLHFASSGQLVELDWEPLSLGPEIQPDPELARWREGK